MGVMSKTPWKIVSSEEKSGSLLISLSFGKLYAEHDTNGEKMVISYRCLSIGAGKGPPAGASWSETTDPSGSFDNIGVVTGKSFSELSFPCRGYMIGVGASAGVVGSILGMDVTGGGLTAVLFGQLPVFAGARLWGGGRGVFPGAGFTGGLAHFWIE